MFKALVKIEIEQLKSIFVLYCIWNVVLLLHSLWTFEAERLSQLFGEDAFKQYLLIYISLGFLIFFVGAILAWLSEKKNSSLASWGFIIFCGWRAIDLIWGKYTIELNQVNNITETTGWGKVVIFTLFWISLLLLELNKTLKKGRLKML
ncbi:MAG: hypothetical protein N0C88_21795 [Candidatus Thiodiazotropha lotti]|uniref:Uncharacterized protein n=1 Tax=Candidatus Thiodiazotropha lotti TaxID=2792787 RepID=A0A9E4K9Q1_9GAMM|nr:hypothetical protein [Candidatus Thiodiazotropha lotti]MCG7985221.1 hypothetical protein [Candidatus Thiodiazotropha lotti]MCW4205939.1 hypothetical protein [Candidatus Thiodiazotropha lotti]ODB99751.1 hypothetical protein A3197_12620 [Candidatus Thiodiazotropha endoloripes]